MHALGSVPKDFFTYVEYVLDRTVSAFLEGRREVERSLVELVPGRLHVSWPMYNPYSLLRISRSDPCQQALLANPAPKTFTGRTARYVQPIPPRIIAQDREF